MTSVPKGCCDYETPAWLFRSLHSEFTFTRDAAASAENALLPRFWTRADSGLLHPWTGERVFCNPPYGRDTGAWAKKAADEVGGACPLAVLVVPGNVETVWFHEHVLLRAAEVRFVKGRVSFYLRGKRAGRPAFSTVIVIYRPGSARCQVSSVDRSPEDLVGASEIEKRRRVRSMVLPFDGLADSTEGQFAGAASRSAQAE